MKRLKIISFLYQLHYSIWPETFFNDWRPYLLMKKPHFAVIHLLRFGISFFILSRLKLIFRIGDITYRWTRAFWEEIYLLHFANSFIIVSSLKLVFSIGDLLINEQTQFSKEKYLIYFDTCLLILSELKLVFRIWDVTYWWTHIILKRNTSTSVWYQFHYSILSEICF